MPSETPVNHLLPPGQFHPAFLPSPESTWPRVILPLHSGRSAHRAKLKVLRRHTYMALSGHDSAHWREFPAHGS